MREPIAKESIRLVGARPIRIELPIEQPKARINFVEPPGFNPNIRLVEEKDGAYLHMTWPQASADQQKQIVTTGLLGKARIPNLSYVDLDGTLLVIDSDYLGKRRNKQNPSAGPFEDPGKGKLSLKVWQGKR